MVVFVIHTVKLFGLGCLIVILTFWNLPLFQLARDPKRFFQKVKELWAYLSADEPENQAPPHNLEELIVMLTRESSRRIVHLVNYTSGLVMHRMDVVQHYLQEISHFIYIQVRKSADVGAKQSALAIEQSKKVAEIAIQVRDVVLSSMLGLCSLSW